jgi:CBS domain-containing membrane protein
MPKNTDNMPHMDTAPEDSTELELTDGDILDAMQHIPGYLDISTEDFRTIYHLAHRHAIGRLFGDIQAEELMQKGIEPLFADMPLDVAAKAIVRSGYKALPVTDTDGHVTGMLTETDFLRQLKVDTFLELLLNMLDDTFEFKHRCHDTPVSKAMSSPAITIHKGAGFGDMLEAFHRHEGRSTPVVDDAGRLCGLLFRKDFIKFCKLENLR